MASLETVSTQMLDCVPKNRNMKKRDLKVLVRDPFNTFHEFLVDDSGSNKDGKSKREVLECSSRSSVSETLPIPFSRLETNSISFYNPGQPENLSRNEIKMGASSLVQFWEARSQQSSSSNSSPFSEYEAKNNNDDLDWCSQLEKSYVSSSWEKEIEEKKLPQLVACTPRIRGGPVFADFLTKILRERKKELKRLASSYMVSKFSPRGCERLQYMLRIKCLERCIAIQERHQSKSVKRYSQGYGVMNHRDRLHKKNSGKVNSAVETKMAKEAANKNVLQERTESVKETMEKSNLQTTQEATFMPKIVEIPIFSEDTSNKNVLKKPEIERKVTEEGEKETRKQEEVSSFKEVKSREIEEYRISPQEVTTMISFEEETASHASKENGKQETPKAETEEALCFMLEPPRFLNGWDENDMNEEDYSGESESNDWVIDISKPQSYWDDLRKQREDEVMMNKDPKKDCMRNMIKKRTVSTFLASDLREEIDKIIISCAQKRFQVEINHEEEEQEEESEERMVECSTRYQENLEENATKKLGLETMTVSDGFSESSVKSRMRISSFEDDEAAITSQSIFSTPKEQENTSSYETDVICDLREQIKQLQIEMLELKSLVQSCVDFQKSGKLESFSGG